MKAIGIDLGTTNSVAAYCEPGQTLARVLENSQSKRWTPSAVSMAGDEVIVGEYALNNALGAPEDTILSVKRLMGRDFDDPEIEKVRERVNYQLAAGSDGDPRVHVLLRGEAHTPADVSAMILRKIKKDATRKLGEEVTHAVITVPAYFKEGQRAATRDAGEKAGLKVRRILDEPTAAAIAFGVEVPNPDKHRILVFDLGGGTFDVSILQMVQPKSGQPRFVVLDYLGDNWLGGDDFDYAIVDRIIAWIKEHYGGDPAGDLRFRLLAKQAAEQAKCQLSEQSTATITIPAATDIRGLKIDVDDLTITRAEFEDVIESSVARAIDLANEALRKQQLVPDDISDVLLVGGSTMTPLVYERVEGIFAGKVRRTVNPMECVALGAAVLAAGTTGVECPNPDCRAVNDETTEKCKCGADLATARTVGNVKVDDVTGMALGIRAVKGADADVFVPIIPSGTPYPLSTPKKEQFQATDRRIKVPVFEGNEPVASRNSEQGVIECELPEHFDANSPVEVSLNFDRNRIITVTVSVPGSEFFRTAPLRHGQPRTRPAAGEKDGGRRSPEDELADTIEFAQRFLDAYESYMEPEQARKLRGDIDTGWRDSGRPRIAQLIMNDIFSCEVAIRLCSADRAREGATVEETRRIQGAVAVVQQAWARGDRAEATEKSKALNAIVKKILERRQGVAEVPDRDFDGLLAVPNRD
ncbi:MAG: Hsp70 family protein [Pseudonocardiaceae bacterium]